MVLLLNRYRFVLRLFAYLLPAFAFVCTAALLSSYSKVYRSEEYVYLLVLTTICWSVAAEHCGVCGIDELFREFTGIRAAVSACTATYGASTAVIFFAHADIRYSRLFLVLSAVLLFLFTLALRAIFRRVVRQIAGRSALRVLIVGTDNFARRAVQRMDSTPFLCSVIGYVHLPNDPVAVRGAPIYELDQLENLSLPHLNDIVIALSPARFAELPEITRKVKKRCLPIRAVIDFGENTFVREQLFQFGHLQLLDLAHTPAESLTYAVLKRGFDIVFASTAILVTAPLMALIVAAIKLTSPGPVFFRQDRVGLSGRVFSMLKFRSMEVATQAKSDTTWTTQTIHGVRPSVPCCARPALTSCHSSSMS